MASGNKPAHLLLAFVACVHACGQTDDGLENGALGGRRGNGGQGQTAGHAGLAAGGKSLGGPEGGAAVVAGSAGAAGAPVSDGGAAGFAGGSVGATAGGAVARGGAVGAGGGNFAASGGISGGGSLSSGGRSSEPGPPLCTRLLGTLNVSSDRVTYAYVAQIAADCRLRGFILSTPFPGGAAEAVNNLNRFNPQLWGCYPDEKPSSFALAFGASELSRAEATLLIGSYLDQSIIYLQLSRPEADRMRSALSELAEAALTDDSDELLHSTCVAPSGEGGQGGQGGGAPGGAAGQGGNMGAP